MVDLGYRMRLLGGFAAVMVVAGCGGGGGGVSAPVPAPAVSAPAPAPGPVPAPPPAPAPEVSQPSNTALSAPKLADCELFPASAIFNTRIDDAARFPAHAKSAEWVSLVGESVP